MSALEAVPARVRALRDRHAEIEAALHAEQARPAPDSVRLAAFKKRKLRLKDLIARQEGAAFPRSR